MLRKFIIAFAAIGAIGAAAIPTSASAYWHGGWRGGYGYGWGGVGAGLVAGALIGSALAAPYYYGPGPYGYYGRGPYGYAYAPGAAYYGPRYRYYYRGGSEPQCGAVSSGSGDYVPCANH
jgi:hypothetical protein